MCTGLFIGAFSPLVLSCFSMDLRMRLGSATSRVHHSQGSPLPGFTTSRVRHSQGPPGPGSATPRVRHSQGEALYSVSKHFINPTSVSANHYYFNQFQLLLAL